MALRSSEEIRATAVRKRSWRHAVELILPLLLMAGLVVPNDDVWRQVVELALLPLVAYYVWTYGLGSRAGLVALVLPLAWIVWMGLSSGWGAPQARVVWHHESMAAFQTAIYFILGVTFVRVTPEPRLELVGMGLVLASGFGLAVSLADHLAVYEMPLEERISGIGLFANSNRAAALASLMTLFSVHLADRTQHRVVRLLLWGYLPLSFVYVILTGSRGGLVVYLAVLAAYVLMRHGSRGLRPLILIAAGIGGAAGLALVAVPDLGESVASNLTRNVYRGEIWEETWRLSRERWLLGYGLGYDEPILALFKHPHDLHLSNLLYGGVPAVLLGALSLIVAAVAALSLPRGPQRALLAAAMLLVLVWSIPNGGVPISKPTDDWYHFWIPMCLAIGCALRVRYAHTVAS